MNIRNLIKNKHAQGEVITTVLLILISIAAVVIVSSFVLNMVRENLKGTECFSVQGQLTINLEGGITAFHSTSKQLIVAIERGTKDMNLTGMVIGYGDNYNFKTVEIKQDSSSSSVYYLDLTGEWSNSNIQIPGPGGLKTYNITVEMTNVSKVSIIPILEKGGKCDVSDEKDISIVN